MSKRVLFLSIIFTITLLTTLFAGSLNVATAQNLFDLINDDVVLFYEEEIAGEHFISTMNETKKLRLQSAYNLSEGKLNAILILQDLGAKVNQPQNFRQLAQMSDKQLISFGKTIVSVYIATLSDEQKHQLERDFKKILSHK